jgi:hypothetical protein
MGMANNIERHVHTVVVSDEGRMNT